MTLTDWIQAVSAAAVAVLTVFLWLLARRQTRLLATSVQVAQQSAEAAQKSAEVAERALIGVQRPLLRVNITALDVTPPMEHPYATYRATLSVTNMGREAAFVVDSAVQFIAQVGHIDPPTPGADPFEGIWCITSLDDGLVIPPNSHATFEIERLMDPAQGEDIANFQGIRGALFVYGVLVYDDPIGMRRELGFTSAWSQSDQAFFRCSLEDRNYDRVVDPGSNPIQRKRPPGLEDQPPNRP